jgi:hypothetical protein
MPANPAKPVIFAFEGFCGHVSDWPRTHNVLQRDWLDAVVRRACPDAAVHYHSQRRLHVARALRTAAALDLATPLIVLGYSNGGHAAADFLAGAAAMDLHIPLVMTADPIPRFTSMPRGARRVFLRPPAVRRWVNVYQRTDRRTLAGFIPLPGCPVPDADENHLIAGLGVRGHLGICEATQQRLADELAAAQAAR